MRGERGKGSQKRKGGRGAIGLASDDVCEGRTVCVCVRWWGDGGGGHELG